MDWTRGRTLGRGSTATVSVATAHGSGELFAVKSADLRQSEILKREQQILSSINCPHIIAYEGSSVTDENGKLLYNLLMEYATGGTLVDVIHDRGGFLGESMIRSYTRSILRGLAYLHSRGIVHCDIKGRNVLIGDEGAKIADLGCAKLVGENGPISGTPLFMAPEVARGEQQGYPSDVWAVGCTVIEMATGRAPWSEFSDPMSAIYGIGFSGAVPVVPGFLSEQAKDFLAKCLKRCPYERWTASQLLTHDFLNEPEFSRKEVYGSNSDSPNNVLDQSFWESSEEEVKTTLNMTGQGFIISPLKRIQELSSGGGVTASMWTKDESWVTVRSKETEMVSHRRMDLMDDGDEVTGTSVSGRDTASVTDEEQSRLSESVTYGDLLWFNHSVNGNTFPCFDCSRGSGKGKVGLKLACKYGGDELFGYCNVRMQIMIYSVFNFRVLENLLSPMKNSEFCNSFIYLYFKVEKK